MKLSKNQKITLYTNLVRTRAYDEMFTRRLNSGKLLGFYHQSAGGEAPGVGACSFLRKDDLLYPHHRGHGVPHMLSKGIDIRPYLAEHLGKTHGQCGGRTGWHVCDPENGVFGWSGTIGSSFPLSVGYGVGAKKNNTGQVVMSCFGDGGSNRGTLHEAFLMSANWKLPIVWLCENNQLSIYVHMDTHHPTENIADLAQGYGMPGETVDGQDVFAVARAVGKAVKRARDRKGPSLIECMTTRYYEHDIGIPDLSGWEPRPPELIEELRKRDPVDLARDKLLEEGVITANDVERIAEEAAAEIAEAERFAEEEGDIPGPEVLEDVYAV